MDFRDGLVLVNGAESGATVRDVLRAPDMLPLSAVATEMPPLQKTGAPYLASFVEVAVDAETGKVDVERLVVVHDAGTVMYPPGAEAQQIGAQVQSVGETLYEEIVYDEATGKPLSFDWVDYTMPTMLDMPQVEPVLLEVWKGAGEYGACGIGESAITCTPRAILNAVYNATGVRINEIPAKPEKVLEALARKQEGRPGVDEELLAEVRGRLDAAAALSAATHGGAPAAAAAPTGLPPARTRRWRRDLLASQRRERGAGRRAADREAPRGGAVVAGGTDLLGLVKDRVHPEQPAALVDLKTIPGLDGHRGARRRTSSWAA